MTKHIVLFLVVLCTEVFGQISGAGQIGCNAAPITGTSWPSGTTAGTTQVLASNITGAQVLVTLDQSSGITAGKIAFLGDPGDGNFVSLNTWQIVDPTSSPFATIPATVSAPYTLQPSVNKQFLILMGGMYRLQLEVTTTTAGGSVTPYTTVACYQMPLTFQATGSNLNASVTFPSAQPVSQSGTWTIGLNTGGNVVGAVTQSAGPWTVIGTKTADGAATGANRATTLPGAAVQTYGNGSGAALTSGRDEGLSVGTDGLTWVATLPSLRPASYSASAQVAPASGPTDIAVLPGNGSNMVIVTGVRVSCHQTNPGQVLLQIIKRSSADTGGTSSGMTVVPEDSTYSPGSSAPLIYTGNPTTGTVVGNLDTQYIGCLGTATTAPTINYQNPPEWSIKPIVLRTTAEQLAVNLGGTTVTGGNLTVTFTWIETSTITE